MAAELRESELDVLGLRLPAIEAGSPDASEAVVFLHGNPGSSRDWLEYLPRVGDFARAVAFDLPGLGRADKPDDWDYSILGYGVAVAAALDRLGIERAHLVMHDLGGAAGLAWAASHPGAFASAVITNTGILIDYDWHFMARLQRLPLLGGLSVRLTSERGFKQSMRRFNRQPRGLPDWYVDQMWRDYSPATRRAMVRMYRSAPASGFARMRTLFRELDRPTLVLWGERDPFIPLEQAELQRESFPSAEVVVLEGSGHWPLIDNPDVYASHLIPFLERQLTGATARAAAHG